MFAAFPQRHVSIYIFCTASTVGPSCTPVVLLVDLGAIRSTIPGQHGTNFDEQYVLYRNEKENIVTHSFVREVNPLKSPAGNDVIGLWSKYLSMRGTM